MTREERWALLAEAGGDELIEAADRCLAGGGAVTVTSPPRTGCVTAQVREPVLRQRFLLGDVLACTAEVELDGSRGWAMRLGDDHAAVVAMAVCDAAFGRPDLDGGIEDLCRRVAARREAADAAEWAELAPTIVEFEEL